MCQYIASSALCQPDQTRPNQMHPDRPTDGFRLARRLLAALGINIASFVAANRKSVRDSIDERARIAVAPARPLSVEASDTSSARSTAATVGSTTSPRYGLVLLIFLCLQ
jgi:hypothetical protein